MPARIDDKGYYELCDAGADGRLLVLNDAKWYGWSIEADSDRLVRRDAGQRKGRTLRKGRYYLVDFIQDPTQAYRPHLFLQEEGDYIELVVEEGLPAEAGAASRLTWMENRTRAEELEGYLLDPSPGDPTTKEVAQPSTDAVGILAHYLGGLDFPVGRAQILAHVRSHNAPEEIIRQLEKIEDRTFSNVTEVTGDIHPHGA